MSTRAYVRYVADFGDHTERAAVRMSHDGSPTRVIDEIAILRQDDDLARPIGYAAAQAFGGDTGSVEQIETALLDADAPVRFGPDWSYEVIVEGPYLTDWQVRVSRDDPPSDPAEWTIDAPLGSIYDDVRRVNTADGLHAIAAEYEDQQIAVGEVGR